ncbi:MAG: threonine dehydratase [Acidimicrobiales bacterium]
MITWAWASPASDHGEWPTTVPDTDYLKRILTARVYDVAEETPLEPAPLLSKRLKNNVLLKREDLQPVFSFKLRGAFNKMAGLTPEQRTRGVIASSAGNHAQGVALAAQSLGCSAVIVMPETAPNLKVQAVRARGAEVILHGEYYGDAYTHALELMKQRDLTFVHPFDDPDVIAGQGTIGMEILRQHNGPLHAVFAPIGGGGLISGVATYIKQLRPEVKIIGVQSDDSDAMAQSIAAGRRVKLDEVGLFCDGTAVSQVGEETFRLTSAYVDDIILVDTDAVCAAIKDVFIETRAILEPSGALPIAGMKAYVENGGITGETMVAIASGANMNFDQLRFVSERAELGEQREAVFAVTVPEERGSFRRFCQLVGDRDVTEFNYRISDESVAHLFVGVGISEPTEATVICELFDSNGFPSIDLTTDELAKVHLRHLVGGKSSLARDEVLYRFEFPEKPGALMRFLTTMSPSWNISLFHYRNHGADYGRVLVGMQVPESEKQSLNEVLGALGYRHWDETHNPAYRLFLGS